MTCWRAAYTDQPPVRSSLPSSIALAAVLGLAACGDKEPSHGQGQGQAATEPAPAKPPRNSGPPAGPTGTIQGVVKFTGTAPQMPKLLTGADPECAKTEKFAETVVVNANQTLRDVLVRVQPGTVPGWIPAETLQLDQKDCVYRPRVQGGVVGQTLEVRNSDQTMHNVHGKEMKLGKRQAQRSLFNSPQVAGSKPITRTLEAVDVMQMKCDAHAWMTAYIVLSDQPYYGVTDDQGAFTIADVPVGAIKLQSWHALYGLKTIDVTVEEGKTATVELSYDASEAPGEPG